MRARTVMAAALSAMLSACAAAPVSLPRMDSVDLPRFMGDWYVIAHVPSWPERRAHNAIETYTLQSDGSIATTFRYRNAPGARLKVMRPKGTVVAGTGNAEWGMQFIWPIRAEYVIAYVDADYQETIVARTRRDYAWIMARTPTIAPERYAALLDQLVAMGYSSDDVRRVPQEWPEPGFPLGREPAR
jgi:apolipoprotein D and lipocalin family protein